MKKYIFLGFCFFSGLTAHAQKTLKPGVVVAGEGNTALAAALQSANSNVKTIWLLPSKTFGTTKISNDLSSGIQAGFLKRLNAGNIDQSNLQAVYTMVKRWTDSTKNLTIITDVRYEKAQRSGKNWHFKLGNGTTIRPKVLINTDQRLYAQLKAGATTTNCTPINYQNTNYRTSVASGKNLEGTNNFYPLYQLLDTTQENYIAPAEKENMLVGQAAGAIAAYAAFFDKTTSATNLKLVQGELVAHKMALMPFEDIKPTDTNWKAIQLVGVTGMLKGKITAGTNLFTPDSLVNTAEIRQPMKDFFYKAQIYFEDYTQNTITIGSALEMICYLGNKALKTVKSTVEKKWKTNYGFKTDLDYNRQISRRELAVLMHEYLPPFNVLVDKNGNITR